ncbi:MAG TPA: hypothetical protein VEB41_05355, partial [Burkholderiales bacterium]|nr:hypothetical protein [Burkholderiales bacterium]
AARYSPRRVSAPVPLAGVRGLEWPPIPGPAGAAMLALQWQLERSQWLSAENVRSAQSRQLGLLLEHAARNVPRYRGLAPERFADWPVLRAAEARADPASLFALRYPKEHGRLVETQTTGSTGQPFRVFHTEAAQFFSHGMVIRDHLLHEWELSLKLATTLGKLKRGAQPGWGLMNGVFPTGPAVTLGTAEGVEAQLSWLIAERPAYLIAHAANLRALLLHSRASGRAPAGLRQLLSHAGTLPPDVPALARALWGAKVVDVYSTEEFGPIASQCPAGERYHVHAEHVLVEVVREDGTPCEPGETGRVLVTALQNFAMPLIRYDVGDYAQACEPCPCGRGLPTLGRIAGRARNMFRAPDGRTFFPAMAADVWLDIAPLRQFRLVQGSLDCLTLHYAMDRELTAYERSALAAEIGGRFGYPYRFEFVRVDSLPREPGEKFEDFLCLVEPPW